MRNASGFDWAGARARVERLREALERTADWSAEDRERIFRERAERLAGPAEIPGAGSGSDAIMVFRVGGEKYGLPLSSLTEVIANPLCAVVPGAPDRIAGVIQVRGEIRPVIDLARLLQLDPGPGSEPNCVILVRARGREFGVRVGEVEDIRVLPRQERNAAQTGAARVMWITQDLIGILNPDSLFEEDVR